MKKCKSPCKSCPWRKDSIRGYLGGNTVEVYSDSVKSDIRVACHTRHPASVTLPSDQIQGEEMCVGFVLARLNDMKRSVDPVLAALERGNKDNPARADVFSFPVSARFHHHHEY